MCSFDPYIYFYAESGAYLVVVVVDNMVLASLLEEFTKRFHNTLEKTYDIKGLREPNYT